MSNRKRSNIYLISALLLPLLVISCMTISSGASSAGTPSGVPSGGSTPSNNGSIGSRTKTSGCVSQNALPDPACTPGAIIPEATKDKICVPGYSGETRNVPDSEKNQVYTEYGIKTHTAGEYEVDHLISLELGGSNDIANLWPEPAEPRPGFHEKDKVENYLHKQVCDGAMSLADAQYQIAHNWMGVYQNMPGK
jgi:hypothetical protein